MARGANIARSVASTRSSCSAVPTASSFLSTSGASTGHQRLATDDCQTVVDRPTPPLGCSTARTTGVAFRFADRTDAATAGATIVVTSTLLLALRRDQS